MEIIEPVLKMTPSEINNLKMKNKTKGMKTKDSKILLTRDLIRESDSSGDIEITESIMKSMMTAGIGLPKYKADQLGIKYPLRKGWFKNMIGKKIPITLCKKLLSDI